LRVAPEPFPGGPPEQRGGGEDDPEQAGLRGLDHVDVHVPATDAEPQLLQPARGNIKKRHKCKITGEHINDYLSDLIESTTETLEQNKCIAIEESVELLPLNFGYISSYYYIKTDTVELFAQKLDSQARMESILEVLSQASEFQYIPIRRREDHLLRILQQDLQFKISKPKFNAPSTKTYILLQCHFSRLALTADFSHDQRLILSQSLHLISGTSPNRSHRGRDVEQLLAQAGHPRHPALAAADPGPVDLGLAAAAAAACQRATGAAAQRAPGGGRRRLHEHGGGGPRRRAQAGPG